MIEGSGRRECAVAARFVLHRDARWFMLPTGQTVDCSRHKLLRRLLLVLAATRLARTGEPLSWSTLVAAGWPDERILPRAARNRIHVALSRLRRLGLGPWLVHVPDGWMLSPTLDLELSDAPGPWGATQR
jgi:hypothetical protein